MSGILVVGEPIVDGIARISAEAATAGRALATASGLSLAAVVAGPGDRLDPAAAGLAGFASTVTALELPDATDGRWAAVVAPALVALVEREAPDWILLGATPDGRDLAGVLSALLGWGILTNGGALAWSDRGPTVEATVFGGRLVTTGGFRADRGIVLLLPNSVDPEPLATPGTVTRGAAPATATSLPAPRLVERIAEGAGDGAALAVDEASIVVTGGRGVGGPEGFALVESLAAELGGAVGATRAAVDAGWITYARQVGQTGKVVKPKLYVALGVSGAIQHKVGMQSSGTIVAVNRDPDAPITEFADLLVIGDLHEVVPALVAKLRARRGG